MMLPNERVKIAAEAGVSINAVSAAYRGRPGKPTIRARIKAAAEKLGLPVPPDAAPAGEPGAVGGEEGRR